MQGGSQSGPGQPVPRPLGPQVCAQLKGQWILSGGPALTPSHPFERNDEYIVIKATSFEYSSVLAPSHIFAYLGFTVTQWGRYHFYPHFIDKLPVAQNI